MCGHVSVFYKRPTAKVTVEKIQTGLDSIFHRGPDDTGIEDFGKAILGFSRLSIIDLANGHQPYHKADHTMIFNGEIYNYQTIREDLKAKGYTFSTNSDTEVLLTSYLEYGKECVAQLRGMFTFLIWDEKNEKMFGAADHFGIKPLYYIETEDYVAFSSEYKALLPLLETRTVDTEALQSYLSFQFVPLGKTMLKEIKKVPVGYYFSFEDGQLTFTRYHQVSYQEAPVTKEDIYDVMVNSVKAHMIADVEVGTFLSGGIDSSIIAAIASQLNPKIKSFTVGFDVEGYNEMPVAKKTAEALGIENISHIITQKEYIEALPDFVSKLDDPMADASAMGIYFLSKEAKKHVKVVMSGEGSDEFFGGYNIYKEYYSIKPLAWLPDFLKKGIHGIARHLPDIKGKSYLLRATSPLRDRYIGNAKIFENEQVAKVMKHADPNYTYQHVLAPLYDHCEKMGYDYVTTMQFIDMNTWLQGDILIKGDKMSMAHSLELRVPFLDKEVMAVASRLSLEQKVTKANTKVLLRAAFDGKIPSHVVEKKKLGFPTPIRVWLKSELGDVVRKTIQEADVDTYIQKDYVLSLLDDHQKDVKDNSRKVWTVFIFCLWHQLVVEQKDIQFKANTK